MKDITSKIFEAKQSLVSEIQNEYNEDYAYQSFNYEGSQKKYDYGFLVYDNDNEFISVTAFNEDSEEAEEFAIQYNVDLEELMDYRIGGSENGLGSNYKSSIIRIW